MDVLAAHALRQPDKPALIEGERVWSWAGFIARRNRLGHDLVGLGLPAGGHVIIYAENSLEHYLAGAAARAAGLIPAPMNHRLVAEEVADILDHSDAIAVLVSDRFLPMIEAGALRRGMNSQDLTDTLRAMDLLDPAHVHLVAGPVYHSAPGGLALYASRGLDRGHHARVRSGAGAGRDRAASLHQHLPLYVRRGPGILDEYYRDPEATERMRRGEWYTVGDVAYVDGEGFYYICDRKRDMIISAEVEDVLHRHPKVLDAAVFGVPDEECEVSFHDVFPRDAAGKLLKRRLREPYWAGRASRV